MRHAKRAAERQNKAKLAAQRTLQRSSARQQVAGRTPAPGEGALSEADRPDHPSTVSQTQQTDSHTATDATSSRPSRLKLDQVTPSRPSPVGRKLDSPEAESLSDETLAAIKKYSHPGEDLDWTKVTDIVERKRRWHTVVNRRSTLERQGKVWTPRTPAAPPSNTETTVVVSNPRIAAPQEAGTAPDNQNGGSDSATQQLTVTDITDGTGAAAGSEVHVVASVSATAAAPGSAVPSRPVLHPTTGRPISARSLAEIEKYTQDGEHLDWTKVKDKKRREQMTATIKGRKSRDVYAQRTYKGRLSEVEALEQTRDIRKRTERLSRRTTKTADSNADDESDLEEEVDDASARLLVSSTPVLHPANRRQVPAQSLADIAKYALPGEDLDWTKRTDPGERKELQKTIRNRKRLDPDAVKTRGPERVQARDDNSMMEDDIDGLDPEEDDVDEDDESDSAPNESQTDGVSGLSTIKFEGDSFSDHEFVQELNAILHANAKGKSSTFHSKQCRRIGTLLDVSSPPLSGEVLFLGTGDKAAKYLMPNEYFPGPMILYGQQSLPLQTQEQFFSEYYDDTMEVNVQDPSTRVASHEPHVRRVTMAAVKTRLSKPVSGSPWNLLELAAHREDGLRPGFLNNEECSLLMKLKLPRSGEAASRLGYTEGWKEVEKWTLVAQAGALTEPHQDSHGYSTYITVNQGTVGFGWLSNPTAEERAGWAAAHDRFIGGRWRYVILRAGATIYFPASTVHFVFRHPAAGNTLAFGGHVLRCSQIVRWIKVLLDEQSRPNITNEDMSVSAPGYLNRVEKFVKQAQKTGKEEMWGGKEAIVEFLRLKQEFTAQATRIAKRLR